MVLARCGLRGAAKAVNASALVALLLVSIGSLGVALGYSWARVDLVQNNGCLCGCTHAPCSQSCCVSKLSVQLTPFNLRNETNGTVFWANIYHKLGFGNPSTDFSALPVVVAGSIASGVLSFVCLFVVGASLFLNSQNRLYKLTATVIYLLCLFSSLLAVIALAAFLDFYIWKVRDGTNLVPDAYFGTPAVPHILLLRLDWAFYVHAGGVCSSVAAFMAACVKASLTLAPPAAAPPPRQSAPPLAQPALPLQRAVTVLVYDKEQAKWVTRKTLREGDKKIAMEAHKESLDAAPNVDQGDVTTVN